ncbi:hypothetical protein IFM89_032682 [Coptis chinensis]|uniref:Serine incorporator n=1 Tax=Coptis chinensis TaxID=261450 RepID=A0A835II25_9MAGN|nr:hypothetical protein IFM89_032682 [Coptis chinensis]
MAESFGEQYKIKELELKSSNISLTKTYIEKMEHSFFSQFLTGSNPWMARYVYSLFFLVMNVLAWAIRDNGHEFLKEMQRLKDCNGGLNCLGTEGVLRVSLGCFIHFNLDKIFYFTMFLSTAGSTKLHEPRDSWHSGWWFAKIFLSIGFMVVPFFIPNTFIAVYGEVAHFGAGVFLLIQLISIISFIMWLDDCCRSDKYSERCYIQVTILSLAAYVACIAGVILMYICYAPRLSCVLNIFFITLTLVILHLMTSVSLHPKINAGFLTPGLMGLYVVFICWCALRSEPPTDGCNKNLVLHTVRNATEKDEASQKADWLTIISFVIAVLAMVIATFSTGIDSKSFQFRKDEARSEDDVPYGYGFFHFVFAMGAMYFAMLLIGWNTHHTMKKWTIDVGWTSSWVRIVNEWLAACLYSEYLSQTSIINHKIINLLLIAPAF